MGAIAGRPYSVLGAENVTFTWYLLVPVLK